MLIASQLAIILLATFNLSSATLYVAERYNGNVDAIDTVTGEGRVVASGLGGMIGATVDRRGRLFVHRFDAGAIALVDTVNNSFVDIVTGISGHGLCADTNSDTLYLAGYATSVVYRITEQEPDNWQVDVVSSGLIQPIGVYLQGRLLYVADRGGFLYAQQLDAGPPEIVVALPSGGDIIDQEAGGDLIIGTASQDVYQVDIVTRQIVRTFGGFANPAGLVVDPTDNSVLVCEHDGHRITRFVLETGERTTVTEFVETPYQPVFAKDSICSGSNQPPTIRSQPIGQTNYVGENARLSVFATGTCPLSHQWRKQGLDLVGATNATLVPASATVAATGDYTVVVANAFGSVTSAVARVTITERPWPYVEEFQGSVGREWSHRQTDVTPVGNRRFLGQFGNDTVNLTLNGLPPHQEVKVSFDLFVIRSWDGGWAVPEGDIWDLSVSAGPTLLHTTFNNHSGGVQTFPDNFPGAQHPSQAGAVEIATLGYDWPQPKPDSAYYLSFRFPHTGSSLKLDFSGMGLQDIGDESWGLDNVRVELSPPPTNTSFVMTTLTPTYASPLPPTNSIYRVATSGTHAVTLSANGSVQWLDLKDPAKPQLLGTWEPYLMPCDIAVSGNLVYIASWELDFLSTVEIVDFSDPAKPVLKGYYDTPGYAQDVAIAGSRAYVADAESGLHILDVSDPAFPQRLGGYNIHGVVDRVQVSGRYAYLTVGNWVCILDVSDPANPRRAGVFEALGGIQSMMVSGSKLYLAQQIGELQILDVSDPGDIKPLGSFHSYGTEAIAVAGRFAYLAGSGGVRVLDVNDPPKVAWLAGTWNIPAEDVALMGNYAVVAGGDKGLAIYQLQQSIYPPLRPPVIAGGMMTLTWPYLDGARLQMATNLAQPFWQDIPASEGTNTVSLPISEGAAFFRLATGPKLSDRFVWIPPGTFTMGSPNNEVGRNDDEGPQTVVTISRGFWMGKYEVTQAEYESVMGTNPSCFTGDPNRPVELVSWYDATNYCGIRTQQERAAGHISTNSSFRLPTEAEWEYACRAGTTTRFSYGDDPGYTNLANYAWWDGNSAGTSHPVGQKLPNAWGLYDMSGNLFEWCQDWYETYAGGTAMDPQGPVSGSVPVLRGGSWNYWGDYCRSAFRTYPWDPGDTRSFFGFRVVLVPGQP